MISRIIKTSQCYVILISTDIAFNLFIFDILSTADFKTTSQPHILTYNNATNTSTQSFCLAHNLITKTKRLTNIINCNP